MSRHRADRSRRWVAAVASSGLAVASVLTGAAFTGGSANADTGSVNFDSFAVGTPDGQAGWSKTGPYDHEIVANGVGAPPSFGTKSLRLSNAVTSGAFGDQTFSSSLGDGAGESGAASGGLSGGTTQPHFETTWDFTSADPSSDQSGLSVVVSPDRGDGARMSWIQMTDEPGGLGVNFFDYRDEHPVGEAGNLQSTGCSNNGASNPPSGDGFFSRPLAAGLARGDVHTVKVSMDFLEGPRNDVVRIWVDGDLVHVGTSWEDYFRYCEGTNDSRTVDSLLFRTAGAAAPATAGKGFLVDNIELASGPIVNEDSTGNWTLYPEQSVEKATSTETSTTYQAKVRPPINADGTSNFPKRRGVIPVQFDLESATRTVVKETTTVGPVKFESILSDGGSDNDYSFLNFAPDDPVDFADLNSIVTDYDFIQGNCGGGSLRWMVRLDTDGNGTVDESMEIHFGTIPDTTDCTGPESLSGVNLLGGSDARFNLVPFGGNYYGTYAEALDAIGRDQVVRATLIVDSGWFSGDQVVDLQGASVDGAVWKPLPVGTTTTTVSDTSTPLAKTCDLPEAKLRWSKNDYTATGVTNEAVSIQPGDSGEFYRQVDCKYIYNLDVSSLDSNLGTRAGTYRVWVNIGGANVPAPAKFDLK